MREAAEAVVIQMVPESSGRDDLDRQTPPFLRILDNVLVQLLVGVRPGDLESLDLTGQRIDPDFEDLLLRDGDGLLGDIGQVRRSASR